MPFKDRTEMEAHWAKYAKALVGRKIVQARYMTREEADACGWTQRPVVLQLDDSSLLWPSSDDEGNDAGAMHGQDAKGGSIGFPVLY